MSDRGSVTGVLIKLGVVLLIVAAIGSVVFGVGEMRDHSHYSGHVVDIEEDRGTLLRTTQIHLKTSSQSSQHETFCVKEEHEDDQLPKLKKALREDKRVTVHYSRPLAVPIWECESGTSIVRGVEMSNETHD